MAVEAIQKNNTYNSGKMSVAGSAVVGALAGYSLKWALPITHQEKDERYKLELKKINTEARLARNAEKKLIAGSKLDGADTFVKMNKKHKLIASEIEKLEGPEKDNVKALFNRINSAGFKVKAEGKKALKSFTKGIRSTGVFVTAGIGACVAVAFIHNVLQIVKADNNFEDCNYY